MILYHGTSEEHLEKIKFKGLQPRDETGISNWDDTIKSKSNLIYLTDCYAIHFACASVKEKSKSNLIVIKVEIDEEDLLPDEDFIAQVMVLQGSEIDLFELTERIDPFAYKHHALDSLNGLGTVAIEEVRPEQIIDFRVVTKEVWMGSDPSISLMNHSLCSRYYEKLNQYLFGEIDELPEMGTEIISKLSEKK